MMRKPRQIRSKTLTFELIVEKKILRIEDVCGNEVHLGWESVSEVWSLETVLSYRLSYSCDSNFTHFYNNVIRAVAEISGNVNTNIYNIVNRLPEKSDNKYGLLKKLWMWYAEQHWTKAIDLKLAVEHLYEKLGALEFDADHEFMGWKDITRFNNVNNYKTIIRLEGSFVKHMSEIRLQHFLDTINKYIKDSSDSDTSSSDEEECKAGEQNSEGSKTTEEEESKKSEGEIITKPVS
ncbi:hypothetical protein FQA39_LY04531 [Lamprigera yunnana]|nr:hypothetical protein FQA39_LY04531 [Lamprigera yunnana]